MDKTIQAPRLKRVDFYVNMYFFRKRDRFFKFFPIPCISFEATFGGREQWEERMIVIAWLMFQVEIALAYIVEEKKGE